MCLILRSPRCVRCYDSQPGNVAATFYFGLIAESASDGTLIKLLTLAAAKPSAKARIGAAYRAGATASVVLDGLSMIQPTYVGATVGKDGTFAQAGGASSTGSRGVVQIGQSAKSMDIQAGARSVPTICSRWT